VTEEGAMTDESRTTDTEPLAFEPMTDAEAAFARRLAEDLERVLGEGIAVSDVELHGDGPVRAHVVCLADGRVHEIDAEADDVLAAYQEVVRKAAEIRLAAAWWRIVGPT
jgi:hypothetical protein